AGAEFSLKTLARLQRGEATLASLDLSMRGEAPSSKAYHDVRTALARSRPTDINLVREEITPPVAKPYVLLAKKGPDGVTISGYAPTDDARGKLVARAKSLFANVAFADRTDIADGAPDGWGRAVAVAIEELAQLKSGEAAFSGRDLTFSGEAADEQ